MSNDSIILFKEIEKRMSGDQMMNADVLIIGAGLSGVMAARELEAAGVSVMIIDKGRSVGGRMATRRIGDGRADHGAQFFTVRDERFQQMVDELRDEGLIYVWSNGFSDGSLATDITDGHPRYVVREGMNALPRYLAQPLLNVRVDTKIVTATCDDNGWILQDDEGTLYTGKALLMTSPVPQSLQILDEGATVLAREDFDTLNVIEYAPCLAGMFKVRGVVTLPQPGAIQRKDSNITWIGDNRQKGISPDDTVVTVQASETYSTQMWNSPDERILAALETALEVFMREGAVIEEAQLKRWRYSRPLNGLEDRYYIADNTPTLMFAGDAFGGPRVEGAILSGVHAGGKLVELLQE
jgi:renalase